MKENKRTKLAPGEKIPLSFDEAARIMFTNPNRMEPLNFLVSLVLDIPYSDVDGNITLLPPRQDNMQIGKKKTECDIIVTLNTEEEHIGLIIEINRGSKIHKTIMNRNIFYMNRLFTSGLKESEDYGLINDVFLINFNTFYVDNINKEIFDYYYIQNKYGHLLTEKQKILCINIAECYKLLYDKDIKFRNSYERKLFYFSCAMQTNSKEEFEICLKEAYATDVIRDVILEVSDNMNNSDELVGLYYDKEEDEAMIKRGIIREEREEAFAEGKLQTQKEMIMNMYNKGYNLSDIKEISNMTIQEIKDILGIKASK